MKKAMQAVLWTGKILVGCVLFALGFNLFLEPNGLNAGGLSGLAMVLVHVIGYGSVGVFTAIFNLPLFLLGGKKIGKQVLAVVNFPPRQIADFMSEVLVLGTYSEGGVVLITPDKEIKNGDKLG